MTAIDARFETFYACRKHEECRDEPVSQANYRPHDLEWCRTHNLPMNVKIRKERRR